MLVESGQCGSPDALPQPFLVPMSQAAPDRRRRPVLAWQMLPAAARDEHVEDALEGAPIIGAWPSSASGGRQVRADERPLPVSQMNPKYNQITK